MFQKSMCPLQLNSLYINLRAQIIIVLKNISMVINSNNKISEDYFLAFLFFRISVLAQPFILKEPDIEIINDSLWISGENIKLLFDNKNGNWLGLFFDNYKENLLNNNRKQPAFRLVFRNNEGKIVESELIIISKPI